jgi:hypothetical protein
MLRDHAKQFDEPCDAFAACSSRNFEWTASIDEDQIIHG